MHFPTLRVCRHVKASFVSFWNYLAAESWMLQLCVTFNTTHFLITCISTCICSPAFQSKPHQLNWASSFTVKAASQSQAFVNQQKENHFVLSQQLSSESRISEPSICHVNRQNQCFEPAAFEWKLHLRAKHMSTGKDHCVEPAASEWKPHLRAYQHITEPCQIPSQLKHPS